MASDTSVVDLRRVRNVLRHQRPEVIEVEVVPAAGGVLVEQGGDLDRVVARRHAAAHLQIGRGAAVLVQIQIVRGRHAVDGDGDLAAIGVEEGPKVEIVLPRVRVAERDLANVQRARWARCAWRARCSTTATGKRAAILVVLPKAGVLASRVRFLDPIRPAADLQAPVAGDRDVGDRAAPLHVAGEAAHGRELLHARARRPRAGRRGLVAARHGDLRSPRPRTAVGCAPPESGVPMKYRPPVSFEVSSTLHVVSEAPTPAVRKQPSWSSCFDVLEARREDHVHLPAVAHRNHRADLVQQGLREVERDVVLRVVVAVGEQDGGPAARRPLESLPAANRDAGQRAAVSDEDAVQIAELPVPRRRPGAEHERQGDAAGARAAGPRLRVNHAALVRTKSAGNGIARRVDDVRELLRHVPGLRLAGHVRAARVAHRYARVERARRRLRSRWSAPRWCRSVRSRCHPRSRSPPCCRPAGSHRPPSLSAVNCVSTRQSVLVTVYRVSRK